MKLGAVGLTRVPTDALTVLLRHVHRGDLECPVDIQGLTRVGLQYVAEHLEILRGLDERAVVATVVCTLAERREAASRSWNA